MNDRYEIHPCDDGEEGWVVVDSETGETLGDELGEVVYCQEELAHAAAKAGRVEMDPSEEDPFAGWEDTEETEDAPADGRVGGSA